MHVDTAMRLGAPLDDKQARVLEALEVVLSNYDPGQEEAYQFPHRFFMELHEQRLLGAAIPAIYGGDGASLLLTARLIEAAAATSPTLGWLLLVQYGLQHLLPTLAGQRCATYFSDVLSAGALLAGSANTRGIKGHQRAGVVEISGLIRYCSGAPVARWISVPVRVHDGGSAHDCSAMIRTDRPGISFSPSPYLHSLRGSLTGVVQLTGVPVPTGDVHPFVDPHDSRLQPPGSTYFGTWQSLFLQNAVFTGTALGAVKVFAEHHGNQASGSPGELACESAGAALSDLLTARSLLYSRIDVMEAAAVDGTAQRMAESHVSSALLAEVVARSHSCVSRLMEFLGGSVLMQANPIERFWRDIQLARAADGTRRRTTRARLGADLFQNQPTE